MRTILFTTALIVFLASAALADTTVSGNIQTDTTWTLVGSPYIVNSTVYVYGTTTTPVTLTIEPGVVVKFGASGSLQIGYSTNKGALVAQGTSSNRITFTRSGTSGNWGGISFQDGTVDETTIIENADISYGSTMYFYSASPVIRNASITYVNSYALYMSSSNPTIENVTISCNGTYGIYISSSNPTITGGSLTNSNASGHGIYGNGSPIISNYNVSIVNTAGKYGLYLSSATSALSVTNSTISNGLYINSTSIIPTITGNTFSNSDNSPPHAGANIIGQILNDNTFTGMTLAGKIEVVGEQINRDVTWKKWIAPYAILGSLYVYKDTTTAATLTIEPGATLKFAANTNLCIGYSIYKGALVAQGTAANRITFTRSGTSGNWAGIQFYDGAVDATTLVENADIQYSTGLNFNSASPVIKNATITDVTGNGLSMSSSNPTIENVTISNNGSYGIFISSSNPTITGGSVTNSNASGHGIYGNGSPIISNYNVSIVNTAGKYGLYLSSATLALSVTNSTISNGLYINSTSIIPTITGNTFSNSDNSPPHAGANIIGQILNDNSFTGMTSAGKIEVVGEQINRDVTWKKWIAPYYILGTVNVYKDATTPATLTIEPGASLQFAASTNLMIGNSSYKGALVAQGTAANRITFTRSGTSGAWAGIQFYDGTVDATTIIENADIQYSTGLSINSALPVIKNATITDVTGNGLYLSYSNPNIENVTVSCNGSYGIYLSSSNPTITGGSLTNSNASGHGIYGSGSPIISNYNVSIVNTAGKYGLYLSSATSALSVTNSTIGNGVYLYSTSITPTVTGNTFSNSDNSPPHAGANIIGQILADNTFTGMTSAGRIEVVGEQINRDTLWKKWNAPYLVTSSISVYKDATTAATLNIEPGTVLKFATSSGLQIGSGTSKGALIADALNNNPITFTSSQATPAPGSWNGLTLNGAPSSASVLNNVIIEYAGNSGNYSYANLTLSSSSPTIRNCIIRNSAGSGIYLSSAQNTPQILSSEITGNKWGIYASYSNAFISNSKIHGNTTAGVLNSTTSVNVDARNNWWGSASGPYHTSNTSGAGNSVSDGVQFSPWIGQTPGGNLYFSNVAVMPSSFNPQGDEATFSASISASANWTITITDSSGSVVRTFTGSGTGISQSWNGLDSQGATVPDGNYTYKIEAVDPATSETAAPYQGNLKVMSQLPIAKIVYPADNQVLSGGSIIGVTGTASDNSDFKSYTLAYGTGDNPASWTTLKTSYTAVSNASIYSWDLSAATGGVYTLKLTVTDNAGNIAEKTVRVRLLWIQNALVSESFISPNGDNLKDATSFTASASYPVNWGLTITNSSGTAVRTTTGSGSIFAATWDGRNNAGVLVPDGDYNYRIDAADPVSSTPASPKNGTVTVDATLPQASITIPAPGAALHGVISILGVASDANLDNYRVEYGPSTGAGPWTLISSATTSVAAGPLATWSTNDQTNTVPVSNGSYSIKLTVADKAGNTATASVPVSVDNLILSNISASSHELDSSTGQTATISYSINKQATVTLKIVPEKLGVNGTPVYQTAANCAEAGSYSFTWNGRNSAGSIVPDEAYLYILEATDGTLTDSYAPAASTGSGALTCSQSSYNPLKNIPLTVSYAPDQPSRVNISISWGSQNFKIMDGTPHVPGSYTYNWDGRNPTGKILASGAVSSCAIASYLPENHVVVRGGAPKITSVKTDPSQISLSYGQHTKIRYTLESQANISISLVSPSGASINLSSNVPQSAGDYELVWNALDQADVNERQFLSSEEGDYTVVIQAISPGTGANSIAKGTLNVSY